MLRRTQQRASIAIYSVLERIKNTRLVSAVFRIKTVETIQGRKKLGYGHDRVGK
jgi:hypothetical protein